MLTDSQRFSSRLAWLAGLFLFCLGAFYFIGRSTYALGPLGLLLLSCFLLLPKWRKALFVDGETRRLMLILLIFALVWAAAFWVDIDPSSRLFDRPLRVLFALPVLLLLLALKPDWRWWAAGIAVGAISAGLFAIYQKLYLGAYRAQGHFHPIQFGNMSMLWGVLCAAVALHLVISAKGVFTRQRQILFVLFVLAAGMGVLGSLLSGSRGGWIGIPFILLVLWRAYGGWLSLKFKLAAVVFLLLAAALVWLVPQTGVEYRAMKAVTELTDYVIHDRNHGSSVGQRLQMWENAFKMFPEHPIMGWGDQGYRQHIRHLAQEGVLSRHIEYGHAHNQFLDFMVKHGAPGLVALLLFFFYPLVVFGRRLAAQDAELKLFATAGSLLCVGFIDFSLTQAVIGHMGGLMAYTYLLVVIWALMKNRERQLLMS